jgi:hypothetical protein
MLLTLLMQLVCDPDVGSKYVFFLFFFFFVFGLQNRENTFVNDGSSKLDRQETILRTGGKTWDDCD